MRFLFSGSRIVFARPAVNANEVAQRAHRGPLASEKVTAHRDRSALRGTMRGQVGQGLHLNKPAGAVLIQLGVQIFWLVLKSPGVDRTISEITATAGPRPTQDLQSPQRFSSGQPKRYGSVCHGRPTSRRCRRRRRIRTQFLAAGTAIYLSRLRPQY